MKLISEIKLVSVFPLKKVGRLKYNIINLWSYVLVVKDICYDVWGKQHRTILTPLGDRTSKGRKSRDFNMFVLFHFSFVSPPPLKKRSNSHLRLFQQTLQL